MPLLKEGGGGGEKNNFCQPITNNLKLRPPPPQLGYLAPSLISKDLTFPGNRVEGMCKCGFSSGSRFEVQGAEKGSRAQRLGSTVPRPCG